MSIHQEQFVASIAVCKFFIGVENLGFDWRHSCLKSSNFFLTQLDYLARFWRRNSSLQILCIGVFAEDIARFFLLKAQIRTRIIWWRNVGFIARIVGEYTAGTAGNRALSFLGKDYAGNEVSIGEKQTQILYSLPQQFEFDGGPSLLQWLPWGLSLKSYTAQVKVWHARPWWLDDMFSLTTLQQKTWW